MNTIQFIIQDFISKLEDPEGQADMNVEEAFEYVEAALNYKYVNYDYSKCANSVEFTGSIVITADANGQMTMTAISLAYDSILSDWSTKYHSIEEQNKTPIVFDITSVEANKVEYTMIVGKGSIDLSKWGEGFIVPPNSIYFMQAAIDMTNNMLAQINSGQIQRYPSGSRIYYVSLGNQVVNVPQNYPSGTDDISLPGNNGYTDYRFFVSSIDPAYNNPHFYLSTTSAFNEYGFYQTQFGQYITDYAYNHGGNRVSYANISGIEISNGGNVYTGLHNLYFYYGNEYYTMNNLSTL